MAVVVAIVRLVNVVDGLSVMLLLATLLKTLVLSVAVKVGQLNTWVVKVWV